MHPTVKLVLRSFVQHFHLVAAATVVCGLLGGVYAFLIKSDLYLASQSLMIRDDASATMMKLGRFESETQMKATQETLMELAKNPVVVRAALQDVGPEPAGWLSSDDAYPSESFVRDVAQNSIALHAPTGIEFGNSEVVYLDVNAGTRERAVALNQALCNRLEARWREVRRLRAESVITELESAKIAAEEQLASTTEKLREMEQQAGSLLSDLRSLTDMVGNSGGAKTQIDQIEAEVRSVKSELIHLQSELESLDVALADPKAYLLAPVELLNSQPGLKKLRDGLADAQMNTATLTGRYTERHPLVIAARRSQSTIEKQLLDQMLASQQTLQQSIAAANTRLANLQAQKATTEASLESLASIRADYVNLTSEFKTRSSIVEEVERELAQARASRQASSSESSLLTRLDLPRVGDRPLGPGRTVLTLAAAAAGSMFGIGVVLLLTPLDASPRFGRRRSDAIVPSVSNEVDAVKHEISQIVARNSDEGLSVRDIDRVAAKGASSMLPQPTSEDRLDRHIEMLQSGSRRGSQVAEPAVGMAVVASPGSAPTLSAVAKGNQSVPVIDIDQKTREQLIDELRLDIAAMDCSTADVLPYMDMNNATGDGFGHVDLHSFDALEAAKQRLAAQRGDESAKRR